MDKRDIFPIEKIDIPVIYVNGIAMNEYEFRALQIKLAKGEVKHPETVVDSEGKKIILSKDGQLLNTPKDFDLFSRLIQDYFTALFNDETSV